ncbi:MAG: DNA polymerase III subunit delta [Candidatus Peribacteraceae bacterium]|nr:DNA polymerase III subunit delta [Candidatus Peribacteraceae bacterium]
MQNVFLFTGLNLFALRQEKRRWMQEFAAKHGTENLLSIDGQSISLQKILDEVSAAPFISTNRLTVINGVPKLAKEEMRGLIDAVHPSCILLFADPAPDKRLGGLKELMASATVKEFSPIRGKLLEDWIRSFVRECGSAIEPVAIQRLLMIAGEDQETLAQELRKLALGSGPTITAAHVTLLAVPSGDQEIWQLTSLLARSDLPAALSYARILLRSGEDPFSLWNMLLWMVRCLVGVTLCVSEGEKNPAKIASTAGVPFPTARTFLPLAQKIPLSALRELVAWSVAADRDLKTGGYRATAESSQELLALIDELLVRCCEASSVQVR